MGKTMKRIHLEPKPKTILGRPFRVVDASADRNTMTITCPFCKQDFSQEEPVMIEEASLIDLLKLLILGMPRQSVTNQDSINAFDFMQQLEESEEGTLKVTDGMHDWLKKLVEKHGNSVYGVNSNAIAKALENFERPHESKDKKD